MEKKKHKQFHFKNIKFSNVLTLAQQMQNMITAAMEMAQNRKVKKSNPKIKTRVGIKTIFGTVQFLPPILSNF